MFQRVATALAFSPRLEANLCEGIRVAQYFNAELVLIHVGDQDADKKRILDGLLADHSFPENRLKIVWHKGDPVKVISRACKVHEVDLLVAGAVQNENLLTYYLGSVARDLCREAPCSILLLVNPATESVKFHTMVVDGKQHPEDKQLIKAAMAFGQAIGIKESFFVEELKPKAVKELSNEAEEDDPIAMENERVSKMLDGMNDCREMEINNFPIFGQGGYTISHFAQSKRADLLVLHAPEKKQARLNRFFTRGIEYVLTDLPTNLLLYKNHAE